MKKLMLMLGIMSALSGCATVFTGTSQSMNIKVTDESTHTELTSVNCHIDSETGAQYVLASNPAAIVLNKGQGPLRLSCEKSGYAPLTTVVNQHFNAVSLLDIFFWPTFFVDYATGAMMKYPSEFHTSMKRG